MSTVQAPIVVNNNLPLDSATVNSSSLQFAVNQTIATKDFTNVAINPISPANGNITFNNFTGSISYNPYPYSVKSSSTVSAVDVSNACGNKINLLGYTQLDFDVAGTLTTLQETSDYTLAKNNVVNANNPTLLSVINSTPNISEFESVQVGDYIYYVGGVTNIQITNSGTSASPDYNTIVKTYSDACYYSYINDNGVMSELISTSALPVALSRGFLTAVGSTLFYMGGQTEDGTVVDTIYSATINTDGSLSAWATSSVTLPIAGSYVTGITINNIIYILNLYPGAKSSTSAALTQMDYYYTTLDSSGALNAWTDGGDSLFGAGFYYGGQVVVLGTTIYVFGGMDYDGGYHADVYSIAITQTNTLSAAVNTNNPLPALIFDFTVLNINSNLYIIGAYQQNSIGGYTIGTQNVTLNPAQYSSPIIYTAPTASDTIGPWSILPIVPPISTCRGGAYYTNNKIYMLGGVNIVQNQNPNVASNNTGFIFNFVNDILAADILLGEVQNFEYPLSLDAGYAQYQTLQVGNRLYAIGGYNNGIASTNIYYSIIKDNDELGQWQLSSQVLPAGIWGFSLVQIQNYVYIIGGFNGTGPVDTVYAATINSDNSLTPFILYGNLLEPLTNATTYVGNNTIYLIAGLGTSQPSSNIYTAPINSTGSIGSWTASNNPLPLGLRNASSVVTPDNTLYVFGNSAVVPANNIAYSIPINADGSLGSVNATANALPATTSQYLTVNLINGVIYLIGNNNSTNTGFDIFTNTSTGGALGTWQTVSTDLPVGTISQSVFNVGNMLYVFGVTDNTKYYNLVYSFIMNFNYSYTINLSAPLTNVPTNVYLTQFVYGSGLLASGGYLQTLKVNTTVYNKGLYTYNYDTIYNTNNGDTVYFQFNNMNQGDLINAFRGNIIGVESVPESGTTT